MKTKILVLSILTVCLLALAGCKKADQKGSTEELHGLNVDLPKFDAEFAKSGPDLQESANLVKRFFRYGQFPEALAELSKLSSNPNLTEPQKKLVNNLIEQTKEAIAKPPSTSGQ